MKKFLNFLLFLISAATKSTNDRLNISNKPNYQKKRKKKKLWYDNECEVKYRHVQNLTRHLSNNPWDKNLRQKVALNKKEFNKLTRKKHRLFNSNLLKTNLESEDKNPSEFWKSVNQLKEKVSNDPGCNISPNEWMNYFKQ